MCENGESNGVAAHGPTTSNGSHPVQGQPKSSPYQSVQDYLSNVGRYKIIESTLREGEQFANSFFDTETKIKMYVRTGSLSECAHELQNFVVVLTTEIAPRLLILSAST